MKSKGTDSKAVHSALLLGAYIVGQGSALAVQLCIKAFGTPELLGLAVVLLSLVSLCVQFAEIGNLPHLVRFYIASDRLAIKTFLLTRAAIAAPVVGYLTYRFQDTISTSMILVVALPIMAFCYSLSRIGVIEAQRRYVFASSVQVCSWLVISLGLSSLLLPTAHKLEIASAIWLLGAGALVLFTYRSSRSACNSAPSSTDATTVKNVIAVTLAISAIIPALAGQVFGRGVMLYASESYGLSDVGTYGLYKYLQVGATLLLGFWLRPVYRDLSVRLDTSSSLIEWVAACKVPIAASILLAGVLFSLMWTTSVFGDSSSAWAALAAPIPFWVLHSVVSLRNSFSLRPQVFVSIELLGLLVNGTLILTLSTRPLAYAIAGGEIAQYMMCLLLTVMVGQISRTFKK